MKAYENLDIVTLTLQNCIQSCRTPEQLNVCENMIQVMVKDRFPMSKERAMTEDVLFSDVAEKYYEMTDGFSTQSVNTKTAVNENY